MIKVSVVVPNHGRDISAIREVCDQMDYVELIEIDVGKERSAQRNMGIKASKGEFIFILDSDQIPSVKLIDECLDIMDKNPGCNGIFIPEIILGDDWFTKLRNYERQFYTSTCIDVVRFVRKKICPQFNESMSGPEDSDWDLRIPPVKLTSKNNLYHDDKISFFNFLKKKSYYTKSMRQFYKLNPSARVLQTWYRVFGVFIEHGKWKLILKNPVAAFLLYVLIFLRAIIYLRK